MGYWCGCVSHVTQSHYGAIQLVTANFVQDL